MMIWLVKQLVVGLWWWLVCIATAAILCGLLYAVYH
jgi:hypothetical protein